MKLAKHDNKLETNVSGETQEFGIGNASVVIEILRNRLYEYKIRTLVQEYICNARDSHRELNKGNQFEITAPTALNPVFKVRDFGPGISPDRISNVFVMYGSSTKRQNNKQTGGFGIGAKSAWSYTDSFTIVSIVDGIKRSYVAHTGVNNNGRLDLISTEKTNEPSGTEIQVAVKRDDIKEFQTSVLRAIYFWKDKPILKGIESPTLVQGYVVSDLVEVIDGELLPEYVYDGVDKFIAVIDGIVYPINYKLFNKCENLTKIMALTHGKVILHFGNGILEVSASRESIADSEQTVTNLNRLGSKAKLEINTMISKAFSLVKTNEQYIKTYHEFSKNFKVDQFANFGEYHISGGALKGLPLKKVQITNITNIGRRGQKTEKIFKETLKETNSFIRVEEFNNVYSLNKEETAIIQNKRIREYLKTNSDLVLLEPLNNDIASLEALAKDLGAKDFQSLTYVEAPKAEKVKVVREKTEFCIHPAWTSSAQYTTLEANYTDWLYYSLEEEANFKGSLQDLHYYLRDKYGLSICGVGQRTESIIKNTKKFKPLKEWLDKWKPNVEEQVLTMRFLTKNDNNIRIFSKFNGVKDKKIKKMVEKYESILKFKGKLPKILSDKAEQLPQIIAFKNEDLEFQKYVESEYPLVMELEYTQLKSEVVFYMNAKLEMKEDK